MKQEAAPTQQTIRTTVNSVELEGIITRRCITGINIEMTQPFKGFSAGKHISIGYAAYYGDYSDKYWEGMATELLKSIYKNISRLLIQSPNIDAKLIEMNERIAALDYLLHTINKPLLRKRFKAGEITEIYYCSLLKEKRNKQDEYNSKIADIKYELIKSLVDDGQLVLSLEQAFKVLECSQELNEIKGK